MKTKNLLLFLGFFFYFMPSSSACDCIPTSFCEVANSNNFAIAFKGKVIGEVFYSENNIAIYVEVEKVYKGNANITDVIKLYGGTATSLCQIDLITQFPIGTEMIAAVSGDDLITNPDAANEDYWESSTIACSFVNLTLENNNVMGSIAPGLSIYAFENFEKDFANCSSLNKGIDKVICDENNLLIYPNPVFNDNIFVVSRYFGNTIKQINIYSSDARLVKTLNRTDHEIAKNINLSELGGGVYMIEFIAEDGVMCTRKFLIY